MLNVGILIFDEVEVLDFAGPFEVFSIAEDENNCKIFNVFTISEKEEIFARNGLGVKAQYALDHAPHLDILVIPGGYGAKHIQFKNTQLLNWIKTRYIQLKIIFSVCTGAFILAEAGLLMNLKATTHWMELSRLKREYPQIEVIDHAKYVDEGKVVTSGGISSGIHASLYIVARLKGIDIALKTAKIMEFETNF